MLLFIRPTSLIRPTTSLDEKERPGGQNIVNSLPLAADGKTARESGGIQRVRAYPGKAVGCRDKSIDLLLEEGLW